MQEIGQDLVVEGCFSSDCDFCYGVVIDSLHDRGHGSYCGDIRATKHVDTVGLSTTLTNRCRSLGDLVFDTVGPYRPVRLAENAFFYALRGNKISLGMLFTFSVLHLAYVPCGGDRRDDGGGENCSRAETWSSWLELGRSDDGFEYPECRYLEDILTRNDIILE
jgi:hypothetical protein